MTDLYPAIATLAAYLIGSLSFAVIVSRLMGLNDPRTYGSGNPGATNVLRSGNRRAAIATLALDALKGYVAVIAAYVAMPWLGIGVVTVAAVGFAAFLGHLWPVFFRFEGGKGVATAAGVLLGLNPYLGAAVLATWLIVAVFTRYSSLAAIVAAVFAPLCEYFAFGSVGQAAVIALMSALLVWRHLPNIRKLLAGTESRLGQKVAR